MTRRFEAEAALRELERLHEWVERQKRNLSRIKDLDRLATNTQDVDADDDADDERGKDYQPAKRGGFPY